MLLVVCLSCMRLYMVLVHEGVGGEKALSRIKRTVLHIEQCRKQKAPPRPSDIMLPRDSLELAGKLASAQASANEVWGELTKYKGARQAGSQGLLSLLPC